MQATTPSAPTRAPRRTRLRGHLTFTLLGAALAALAVSSVYEQRTLGERIDAGIDTVSMAMQAGWGDVRRVVQGTFDEASFDVAGAVSDAAITAAVKTALAADPSLSALRIDVFTRSGVVLLEGPAPDARARDRAAVLAAAPKGVVSVDNRLTVSPL